MPPPHDGRLRCRERRRRFVGGCSDAIAAGNVKDVLNAVEALLTKGISLEQFVDVLIEYLRQLMLIAACGPTSELVELSDDNRQVAAKQAEQFDAAALTYMIALCENMQRSAKSSANTTMITKKQFLPHILSISK